MLLQSCSFLFVKALVMPSCDHPGEGSIYRSIGIEPTHLQPNRVTRLVLGQGHISEGNVSICAKLGHDRIPAWGLLDSSASAF